MNTVIIILGLYFSVGLASLIVFDLITGRIRSRLGDAGYDTQEQLLLNDKTRVVVGRKMSIMLTLLAVWLLWPAVFYSAVESRVRRK